VKASKKTHICRNFIILKNCILNQQTFSSNQTAPHVARQCLSRSNTTPFNKKKKKINSLFFSSSSFD